MRPSKVDIRRGSWDDAQRILQNWIDSIQGILGGGMRFGDQFSALVKAPWNSDAKTPIRIPGTERPIALLVLAATAGTVTVSPVSVSWSWQSGAVTITAAPSLSSSTDYALTMLVVYG